MWLHIELIEYEGVGSGEHQRIFDHLVVSLRHTEQGHAEALSNVELRRTHQVADVFYEYDIQIRQGKLLQQLLDAHGLDVTRSVCIQLDHWDPHGVDFIRIHLSGDVAFDDADAVPVPEAG